jgi:hypothetical protein
MSAKTRILTMGIAATLLAGSVFAQTPGSGSAPTKEGYQSSPPASQSPKSTPAPPSASPSTSASGFMGRHTMTGEVTKIDNQKGMFSLKTKEGTLDLHAPPSALQGVKRGDQVAVEIAVKPMK